MSRRSSSLRQLPTSSSSEAATAGADHDDITVNSGSGDGHASHLLSTASLSSNGSLVPLVKTLLSDGSSIDEVLSVVEGHYAKHIAGLESRLSRHAAQGIREQSLAAAFKKIDAENAQLKKTVETLSLRYHQSSTSVSSAAAGAGASASGGDISAANAQYSPQRSGSLLSLGSRGSSSGLQLMSPTLLGSSMDSGPSGAVPGLSVEHPSPLLPPTGGATSSPAGVPPPGTSLSAAPSPSNVTPTPTTARMSIFEASRRLKRQQQQQFEITPSTNVAGPNLSQNELRIFNEALQKKVDSLSEALATVTSASRSDRARRKLLTQQNGALSKQCMDFQDDISHMSAAAAQQARQAAELDQELLSVRRQYEERLGELRQKLREQTEATADVRRHLDRRVDELRQQLAKERSAHKEREAELVDLIPSADAVRVGVATNSVTRAQQREAELLRTQEQLEGRVAALKEAVAEANERARAAETEVELRRNIASNALRSHNVSPQPSPRVTAVNNNSLVGPAGTASSLLHLPAVPGAARRSDHSNDGYGGGPLDEGTPVSFAIPQVPSSSAAAAVVPSPQPQALEAPARGGQGGGKRSQRGAPYEVRGRHHQPPDQPQSDSPWHSVVVGGDGSAAAAGIEGGDGLDEEARLAVERQVRRLEARLSRHKQKLRPTVVDYTASTNALSHFERQMRRQQKQGAGRGMLLLARTKRK